MVEKSLLELTSEQLDSVRNELGKINFQHTENLRIDELDQLRANELRHSLARLRKQLNDAWDINQQFHAQKAIHNALIFLAEKFPLNLTTEDGQWRCPITEQTFSPGCGVVLTNGCYYPRDIIGSYAAGQKYFPKTLPGSPIEIDSKDINEAQQRSRGYYLFNGLTLGAMFSSFVMPIVSPLVAIIAKVSLFAMAKAALIALGMTVAVAGVVATVGFIAIPLIVGLAIGGLIGAYVYDKTHPSAFAPSKKNEKLSSSTEDLLSEMGVDPVHVNKKKAAKELIVDDEDVLIDETAPLMAAAAAPGSNVSNVPKL